MKSRAATLTVFCAASLLAMGLGVAVSLGPSEVVAAASLPERAETDNAPRDASRAVPPHKVAAQGRVEPVSEKFELAIGLVGTLAAVNVDEGDAVRKGQLLAEMVNGDQRGRVVQAEAQVRLRRAELEKLLNGARPEERRQAGAQFEKAEADLGFAKLEFARQRPLAVSGVASRQRLDQTLSTMQAAQASGDAAKAAMELINAPPRSEDVEIARANLALAEGNLAEQRMLFDKTQLRSPIDGIVLRRYMKTGETVSIQPLIPILQVGDMRGVRIRAEIDESDIGRVELDQRAWITVPAYPNRRFGGHIARIGHAMGRKTVRSDEPTEKTDTNILEVLIDLDDAKARLPSGLRVNVFLDTSSAQSISGSPDEPHRANRASLNSGGGTGTSSERRRTGE